MAADLVNPKRRMAKGVDLERSTKLPESEFLTFKEAKESITPAYVARRTGTTTLFLLGF
jgi:hypothetical protein